MESKLRIGIIGLGQRGPGLTELLTEMEDIVCTWVCDKYADRVEKQQGIINETHGYTPKGTTDWHDIIAADDVDAVFIFSSWETHVPIAVAAMEAGKPVATEVGGAYDVNDCWQLVRTYEKTKTPFMFLENCCYSREEMMVLNLVKLGIMGEVVHCDGAYIHELCDEILKGKENRHYRLDNYITRNCENYPTHELGPIAKILNINRGNRMLYLTSMASPARGLNQYAKDHDDIDPKYRDMRFNQGDVVTTLIKCANGETIKLTLETTLPHYYSRGFTIHGTEGLYTEDTHSLLLNSDHTKDDHLGWSKHWDNVSKTYFEKYDHPLWKTFLSEGVKGGHGGCDYLVLRAFIENLKAGTNMPIDVYDAAAWMAVTALSAESIALGSAPIAIPDFTSGAWCNRLDHAEGKYSLE